MKLFILLITLFLLNQDFLSAEDVLRPKGKSSTSTYTSDSKKRFSLGGELGLNYNMYSADMNWTPPIENSIFRIFESADGISPYLGLFVDFEINETFGIHTKLQYNNIYLNYNGNDGVGFIDCIIFDEMGNPVDLEDAEVHTNLESEFNYFVLEPLLRVNLYENFFLLFGPSLQFAVGNKTTDLTSTMISENCEFFETDPITGNLIPVGKTISNNDSEPFTDNRVGINLSLGYIYSISDNISISPQLHFHLMPGKVMPDETDEDSTREASTGTSSEVNITDKNMQNIRLSISLWFENLY